MYNTGQALKQIGDENAISRSLVGNLLKAQGVLMRSNSESHRKDFFDEAAFEKLNEASEYWLGFIFGDGYVARRSEGNAVLQVTLKSSDLPHLEKLKKFLKSSTKIKADKQWSTNRLVVTSRKLVDTLEKYGITQRKSFTAKVRDRNLLKSRHFWRGLIDADGGIYNGLIGSRRFFELYLVGSKSMVTQFGEFVKERIIENKNRVRPHSSIYRIRFAGRTAVPVIAFLYSNCSVFLERKKQLADYILLKQ